MFSERHKYKVNMLGTFVPVFVFMWKSFYTFVTIVM